MNASFEYILAGLIIILVMTTVQVAMTDLLSQRLTALEEQSVANKAEKVADMILLSPGNPENWGNTPAQEPTFFGLAAASSLRGYTLDPYKVMRLNENSTGYISPTRARELLGLSSSNQFSLKITPLMDVEVAGNGKFTITVKDRTGIIEPNVNVTCFYVPKSLSTNSTYSSAKNITRFDGMCTVSFTPKANYVLVVLAEQSAGRSLVTFPQGYDFKVEGGCVFQSDVPLFTEIDYSTGSFSGVTDTTTYRYVTIDGLTYVAQFELME